MPGKAGAIRAGRAFVELFTENSKFVRGLALAKKQLQAFAAFTTGIGRRLVAIGGGILGVFGAAVLQFARAGDQIEKMTHRTGFSAEALSALGFAAEQSGASVEMLDKSLAGMARFALQADRGLASATDVLHMLGLESNALAGLAPEEKFKTLAQAISEVADPTQRAGLALAVFGRSGRELLPLLNQGRDGIQALTDEAERLGLVISTEDATAAAAITDAMNRWWRQIKQIVFQVGAALAPALTDLQTRIAPMITAFIDWVKANSGLIISVAKIALVVLAAGVALITIGSAASALAAILGLLIGTVTTFATVLGIILSPMGLVIAGLAGLTTWLVKSGEASKWLMETFGPLAEEAMAAFGAIKNALAGGDFGAAANVLWSTLKLWWAKGAAWLNSIWIDLTTGMIDVWREMGATIARIWVDAIAGIKQAASDLSLSFGQQIAELALETTGLSDAEKEIARNALGISFGTARATQQSQIEADRLGARGEIDAQNARQAEASLNAYNEALAASQSELDQARREWEETLQVANDVPARVGEAFSSDTSFSADAIGDIVDGLGSGGRSAVEGSFNIFQASAFGTGASSAEERTAKATEETARHTRETAQAIRDGRPVFT